MGLSCIGTTSPWLCVGCVCHSFTLHFLRSGLGQLWRHIGHMKLHKKSPSKKGERGNSRREGIHIKDRVGWLWGCI